MKIPADQKKYSDQLIYLYIFSVTFFISSLLSFRYWKPLFLSHGVFYSWLSLLSPAEGAPLYTSVGPFQSKNKALCVSIYDEVPYPNTWMRRSRAVCVPVISISYLWIIIIKTLCWRKQRHINKSGWSMFANVASHFEM